jgi:hypothetical protein
VINHDNGSPIVYHNEIVQLDLEHKSIDVEFVKEIVESNRPDSTGQDRRILVSNKLASSYEIVPTHFNGEQDKKFMNFSMNTKVFRTMT